MAALSAVLLAGLFALNSSAGVANVVNDYYNRPKINLQKDDGSGELFVEGTSTVTLTLTFREPIREFKFREFFEAQPPGSPFGLAAHLEGLQRAFFSLVGPTRAAD